MAKGISIHVGVNAVDSRHYGSVPTLRGCEADAAAMADLAQSAGFQVMPPLVGKGATAAAVTNAIEGAVSLLGPGDLLLVSYSGHGGRVPDLDGDEADGYDETWCLYDRQLIDDELCALWGPAPRGARILVVSDSCHSGTVVRDFTDTPVAAGRGGDDGEEVMRSYVPRPPRGQPDRHGMLERGLTDDEAYDVHAANRSVYSRAKEDVRTRGRAPVQASVLLLSACKDSEPAKEKDGHGIFTRALLDAWQSGGFMRGYFDFHAEIFESVGRFQTPDFFWAGDRDPAFFGQPPFFIDEATSLRLRLHRHAARAAR
jgi:hypothetical protein